MSSEAYHFETILGLKENFVRSTRSFVWLIERRCNPRWCVDKYLGPLPFSCACFLNKPGMVVDRWTCRAVWNSDVFHPYSLGLVKLGCQIALVGLSLTIQEFGARPSPLDTTPQCEENWTRDRCLDAIAVMDT